MRPGRRGGAGSGRRRGRRRRRSGSGRAARARASSSGSTSASSGLTAPMSIVIGILAASLHPSRRCGAPPAASCALALRGARRARPARARARDSAPSGRARACRPRGRPGRRIPARSRGGSRRTGSSPPAPRCPSNAASRPSSASQRCTSRMPGLSMRSPPPGMRTSCRRVVVCLPAPSAPRLARLEERVVAGERVHERRLADAGGAEQRARHAGADRASASRRRRRRSCWRRSGSGWRRRRPRARRRPHSGSGLEVGLREEDRRLRPALQRERDVALEDERVERPGRARRRRARRRRSPRRPARARFPIPYPPLLAGRTRSGAGALPG